MGQTESEIRQFRHEEEIERLKDQVRQLSRASKVAWIVPAALVLGFAWLLARTSDVIDGQFRTNGDWPYSELTDSGLRSQIEAATYLELGTSPSPGLSLRDGPNAYRIAVVRGKLVAESIDRNGKPIVKVLLDNGDVDR